MLLLITTAAAGQDLSADTSFARPREKELYVGSDTIPVLRLFDAPFDAVRSMDPMYGTFLPLFSFSPDSTHLLAAIGYGNQQQAYVLLSPLRQEWYVYPSFPFRAYWSTDSKRVAVHERFPSGLQKIRIVDIAGGAPIPVLLPDVIPPRDSSNAETKTFDDIRWNDDGSTLFYTIATYHGGTRIEAARKEHRVTSVQGGRNRK